MADIRIKDLATTASSTAADDFLAVDGTTNGTRKLSAATPGFATSVTVPNVVGPTSTALTLTGGSTGASLVLGQGTAAGAATLTATGTGTVVAATAAATRTAFDISNTSTGPTKNGFRILGANASSADSRQWSFTANDFAYGDLSIRQSSAAATDPLSGTSALYISAARNLLIGTTTDAASLAGGLVVNGSGAGAAASSTTTGALRVTGGVGVSGAGYFGGSITASSTAAGGFGQVSITNNASAAINNYMLGSTYGGTTFGGVTGNNQAVIEASAAASSLYLGTGGGSSIVLAPNRTAALTLASGGAATFAGAVTVGTNTIVSSTGVRVTNGGAYRKDYTVAGTAAVPVVEAAVIDNTTSGGLYIANAFSSNSSSWPVLRYTDTAGTVTTGLSLGPTGAVNISSTTPASSSTVGALTIGNGTAATNVAIGGGNVNAGGTLTVGGIASIGAAVSAGLGLNVSLDPGTLTYTAADAWVGARIAPSRAGTTGNAFAIAGQLRLASGTQTRGAAIMAEAPSGTFTNHTYFYANSSGSRVAPTGNYSLYAESAAGPAYIGDTTPSTGSTSGALQVAGGIYAGAASVFGGAVTAAGQIKTSSATTPDLWLQNSAGATSAYRNILLRQNADSTAEFLSVSDAGVLTRANILTINTDSGAVGVGMDATGTNGFAVAGAATFAGAVSIGNTVGTAAAVASTHKVTMVIGGVTYYLLATNV